MVSTNQIENVHHHSALNVVDVDNAEEVDKIYKTINIHGIPIKFEVNIGINLQN